MSTKYLNKGQAATYLGMSIQTFSRLSENGVVPRPLIWPGVHKPKWRIADLDDALEAAHATWAVPAAPVEERVLIRTAEYQSLKHVKEEMSAFADTYGEAALDKICKEAGWRDGLSTVDQGFNVLGTVIRRTRGFRTRARQAAEARYYLEREYFNLW